MEACRRIQPMNWDCHVHVFGPAGQFPVSAARGYTPPVRTLAEVEELAAAAGIAHLVLVQPSVYGIDLFCMLEALRAGAGRHRGAASRSRRPFRPRTTGPPRRGTRCPR